MPVEGSPGPHELLAEFDGANVHHKSAASVGGLSYVSTELRLLESRRTGRNASQQETAHGRGSLPSLFLARIQRVFALN